VPLLPTIATEVALPEVTASSDVPTTGVCWVQVVPL